MLTPDGKRLLIFESFLPDRRLPKFATKVPLPGSARAPARQKTAETFSDEEDSDENEPRVVINTWQSNTSTSGGFTTSGTFGVLMSPPPGRAAASLWSRLATAMRPAPPPPPEPPMSIPEFFRSLHNTAVELAVVEARAVGYERALARARELGQTALYEQLTASVTRMRAEAQLVALGLTKVIDEAAVVSFALQTKRGLRLDWLVNFTRLVPVHVAERKALADARGIFDNYAVLHYDPDVKSFAETAAQTAARKDPILFGLIAGCRKLYFVGDWVDEHCDLTLDRLADVLGAGTVKEVTGEP